MVLNLESVELAHDERMVHAWRRLELREDVLEYSMGMATVAVPAGAHHIAARLERQ